MTAAKNGGQMKINTIAVIGAGVMGGGIAQFFAETGCPVLLSDMNPELLDSGIGAIRGRLEKSAAKGKIPIARVDDVMSRIAPVGSLTALTEADLIVEAVVEDMAVKQSLLTELSLHVGRDAVLATNTSSLSVTEMSTAVTRPERFLGIHFFNPPTKLKLIEIVPTPLTSGRVVDRVSAMLAACGKTPVRVKDSPGFIVNRLLLLLINEAAKMVDEGVATAEDIDTAMQLAALHPAGPLAVADLIGLDTISKILDTLGHRMDTAKYAPADAITNAIADGRLGRKSGQGFHTYAP